MVLQCSTWNIVRADFVSFASVYTRKLAHCIARPLKIKAIALILPLGCEEGTN